MHLYKTMQNFLLDLDYYIDIYEKKIHIFNYIDILKLNEKEVKLQMDSFILFISGEGLRVKQLEKREILLEGTLDKVEFIR